MIILGSVVPNFKADTTGGPIDFHEWLNNSWSILFSHPHDFTPVCTTELARVAQLMPTFKSLGVQVIALSCNSVLSHEEWIKDIKSYGHLGNDFPYRIIADESRTIVNLLGMIDPMEKDSTGIPVSARAVYIIDPEKRIRLSILYPATTGRNFDEIIRVIESLQLCDKHPVATPADWKEGESVMIQPTLSDKDANKLFHGNIKKVPVPSGKSYIRKVDQPSK